MWFRFICLTISVTTALNRISNVALFKSVYQSSTEGFYRGYVNYAGLAVDGIMTHPGKPANGCAAFSSRFPNYDSWWMVDLKEINVIFNITVHMFTERHEYIRVYVGNDTNSSHRRCYENGFSRGSRPGIRTHTFTCPDPTLARWVRMQPMVSDSVNLCEVEVFGYTYEGLNEHYANPFNLVIGGTSVTFQFRTFLDDSESDLIMNGKNVKEYTVELRERGSFGYVVKNTISQTVVDEVQNITLDGLTPRSYYSVRIVPWYLENGKRFRKETRNTREFRTLCTSPEKPIIDKPKLIVTNEHETSALLIQLQALSQTGHNCDSYTYVAGLYKALTDPEWKRKEITDLSKTDIYVTVQKDNVYLVAVEVYNNDNRMTMSDIKSNFLDKPHPTNFSATPPTKSEIKEDAGSLGSGGTAAVILGTLLILIPIVGVVLVYIYFRRTHMDKKKELVFSERKGGNRSLSLKTDERYENAESIRQPNPTAEVTITTSDENYEDITLRKQAETLPDHMTARNEAYETLQKNHADQEIYETMHM